MQAGVDEQVQVAACKVRSVSRYSRRPCIDCIAKAVDLCVGVTAAGMSDKYSWVPNTFPGYGSPLMFDESFKQKPAYTGVVDGWGA